MYSVSVTQEVFHRLSVSIPDATGTVTLTRCSETVLSWSRPNIMRQVEE